MHYESGNRGSYRDALRWLVNARKYGVPKSTRQLALGNLVVQKYRDYTALNNELNARVGDRRELMSKSFAGFPRLKQLLSRVEFVDLTVL